MILRAYYYFTLVNYKLLRNLFYPNLNTQVITNSTVHVYLHESTISNIYTHKLIKYTDT